MKDNPVEISIIIPALNEEQTIGVCVEKAKTALRKMNLCGEIIVCDNNSKDRTAENAAQAGARVVSVRDRGYGNACISGLCVARGDYLILGDADDTYNFEEIEPFVEQMDLGYDFVIGNRFQGKIQRNAMPFLHRYFGTPLLTCLIQLFFKVKIGDINCGFRSITRGAFNQLHLNSTGMEFATEMLIQASLKGLKITEIPCNLSRRCEPHRSHLNTWRDGWRHAFLILLFALD